MTKRWILDREDPRTILVVTVVILGAGLLGAPFLLREGGMTAAFAWVWLLVAAGQVSWAVLRFRSWRARGER